VVNKNCRPLNDRITRSAGQKRTGWKPPKIGHSNRFEGKQKRLVGNRPIVNHSCDNLTNLKADLRKLAVEKFGYRPLLNM
jgi:hypothetical protein